MRKLDKILEGLKYRKPDFKGREKLIDSIMDATADKEFTGSWQIYRWTDITWLRRSLSIASVIIVILFAGQQFIVLKRVNQLESRIMNVSTDEILEQQRKNVIANSLVIEDNELSLNDDSIYVAKEDLMKFARDYRELRKKYEDLIRSGNSGSRVQKKKSPDVNDEQKL
ncbi:MAG TPA: hypothetical protein VJ877_04395 [Bacteroidales bacterium]|nr:hypothetical protein [Bacteroidales bacterium]